MAHGFPDLQSLTQWPCHPACLGCSSFYGRISLPHILEGRLRCTTLGDGNGCGFRIVRCGRGCVVRCGRDGGIGSWELRERVEELLCYLVVEFLHCSV